MIRPRRLPITTENHEFDGLLDRLRDLLAAPEPDPSAVEAELDLLGERLLDALHRADQGEMKAGWRRLRRLFEWAAAGLDDDHFEADIRFQLGRLASLIELAAGAAQRIPSADVLDAVANPRLRGVLEALEASPGAANRDLVDAAGSTEPRVSKDLATLVALGLVDSRKAGRRRMSNLTLLGQEALDDGRARTAPAKPPAKTASPYWAKLTPASSLGIP